MEQLKVVPSKLIYFQINCPLNLRLLHALLGGLLGLHAPALHRHRGGVFCCSFLRSRSRVAKIYGCMEFSTLGQWPTRTKKFEKVSAKEERILR